MAAWCGRLDDKAQAADLRAPEVEQEGAGIALGAGAQSNACGPKGLQSPSGEPLAAQRQGPQEHTLGASVVLVYKALSRDSHLPKFLRLLTMFST